MKTDDLVFHPRFGIGKLLHVNTTLTTIPFASVEYCNKKLCGTIFRPACEFTRLKGNDSNDKI